MYSPFGSIYGVPIMVTPYCIPIRRCKAHGCEENHSIHICNFCGKRDSDHRSKDCPNLSKFTVNVIRPVPYVLERRNISAVSRTNNIPITTDIHCNVFGCSIRHSSHYCNVCNKFDVNHKDEDCPLYKTRNYF